MRVYVCIEWSKYGVQSQAAAATITTTKPLLLGCAKDPSKLRCEKCSKIRRRKKKSSKRNKCKKSTLECGQFYLHCLPLCLITCSSRSLFFLMRHLCLTLLTCLCIAFAIYCIHMSAELSERKKLKVANRLHFFSYIYIFKRDVHVYICPTIYEFLCVRASILVVEVH